MSLMVIVLLLVLAIFAAISGAIRYALKGSIPVRGKTNIPGPPIGYSLPIIGDAWRFARVKTMKDLNDTIASIMCTIEKAAALWIGPKLLVFVADPKMGEAVLNSSKAVTKDPDTYCGFNLFSDGIFSKNGLGWRNLRRPLSRMMQPFNVMEKYKVVIERKSEELCEAFSTMCGKGEIDILHILEDCLVDIVYESLMGIPGESKSPEHFNLAEVKKMVHISMQLAINPLYKFQYNMRASSLMKEIERIQSGLLLWGKRMIRNRREIAYSNSLTSDDFKEDCYIDVVMELNNDELAVNVNEAKRLSKLYDLIVAGYDTSSVAITSAILFLAMHPEYQEKAYREQIDVMGNSREPPTEDQMNKMYYLWMVSQETLRHVGAAGVVRLLTSEVIIGDHIFPEGASVYVSIHYFNMKPEYWVKTKEFYPDNFLPENIVKRPKAAWLPFSAGARGCPGKLFADVSAKIILSMLLRRFKFSTSLKFSDMEYEYMLMLESIKGYPVVVERRSAS